MPRVERIETFRVGYSLAGNFKFFAASDDRRHTLLVRVAADDGCVGWGQAVPAPRWSYETPESVESTIAGYLAPALVGADVFDIASAIQRMHRACPPSFSIGQPIAKAGVELALVDLAGRYPHDPAGLNPTTWASDRVELSWTISANSLAAAEADVALARERGYRHFNIKVAPDLAFDEQLCRRMRELAPEGYLWADANGGYELAAALRLAPVLAELGFAALEQPLPANRLRDYQRLRARQILPIVLDEGLLDVVDLDEFHALGMLDGVAMKVARVGGLAPARAMVRRARELGLLVLGSGLTDPDLSLAASLRLYGEFGIDGPAALNGPQYLRGSLLRDPLVVGADGSMAVPQGPGLGVEVDPAKIAPLVGESLE